MSERSAPQAHMGKGWDAAEREAARQEPELAHPAWECVASEPLRPVNRRCNPCGVSWHGADSTCWLCEQRSLHVPTTGYGIEGHSTAGRYDYVLMQVPPGGCGCHDETVELVAERADAVGVWKACEEIYGQPEIEEGIA